jgi:putative copper export protein
MWLKTLILSFCQWCNNSPWGHGVRDSVWLFPFVEIFHLLALGVLGGTVLILNLRLVGFRFQDEPISELAEDVRPWMLGSLVVMFVSGFLLFSTEAVKMYGNTGFRYKMLFLLLALIFTFTIHRKLTTSDETRVAPVWRWLAAFVSLALWAGVGLGGRSIGYV